MGFIKVKNKRAKEDAVINTDLICMITKMKSSYAVFLTSGIAGAAYIECDEENANQIFQEIGVSS